jgi:hypothetical protein
MDTARLAGAGGVIDAGGFSTCFHPDEVHDGISWGGEMSAVEPCDDILPDGVFTPGTRVEYFFEVRDEVTGEVIGTGPSGWSFSPIDTTREFAHLWRSFDVLPELLPPPAGGCDPNQARDRAHDLLVVAHMVSAVPNIWDRERLRDALDALGFEHDWLDTTGLDGGIGRREDRALQPPRPPTHGATAAQLDPYRAIWWSSGLDWGWLSDRNVFAATGGYPSQDQQTLESWLAGCQTDAEERLLILDGVRSTSWIDGNTEYGATFLTGLGVDVLAEDYADFSGDLRRCARLTGAPATAPYFDGEFFAAGCPDSWPADVLAPIAGGEIVVSYVDAGEGHAAPVECSDDVDMPGWAAIIRRAAGPGDCRRSVVMGVAYAGLLDLDCTDDCLFEDWAPTGGPSSPATLLTDLFVWSGLRTPAPPAAFTLHHPAHGDTGIAAVNTRFEWEPAGGTGIRYTVYLNAADSTCAGADSVHSECVATLVWDEVLDGFEDYFWCVRATDGGVSVINTCGWHAFRTSQLTPVELARFTATGEVGRIVLRWQARSETDHAGYHVWRAEAAAAAQAASIENGDTPATAVFVRLTAELVRGDGSLRFVDTDVVPGREYLYRLEAVDLAGASVFHGPLRAAALSRPLVLTLHQNAPNPFNPTTEIAFELDREAQIKLTVYDVAGRMVRRLVDELREPGIYSVLWHGHAESGEALGSGVYLYELEVGEEWRQTRKMLLVR